MNEQIVRGVLTLNTLKPSTIEITANGEYDVTKHTIASVNVPIPEGYIKPSGTLTANRVGFYNVRDYAFANFSVPTESKEFTPTKEYQSYQPTNSYITSVVVNPIPSEYIIPNGKINITNTQEVDVTDYEKAQVVDANLTPENIAEGQSILGVVGTFKGGVNTTDATATADDILLGKTAYVNNVKIEGTIEEYDGSCSEGASVSSNNNYWIGSYQEYERDYKNGLIQKNIICFITDEENVLIDDIKQESNILYIYSVSNIVQSNNTITIGG